MSAVGLNNGNFRSGGYRLYVLNVQETERQKAEQKAKEQRKQRFNDVVQEIRDSFATQDEYNQWWSAAPEHGFFAYAEDYLIEIKLQDCGNILTTRRESILAAMREEAMSKETALELIDELAEIETSMQKSADPTGQGWFDFEKIQEIKF